jgi:hypothetical protein
MKEIKWTLQLLAYVGDVDRLGDNIGFINRNTEKFIDASKEMAWK